MALVAIYSKLMGDLTLRTYSHVTNKDGATIHSNITSEVIINGRNSTYKKGRVLLGMAVTMVDKEWWDKWLNTEGVGNPMIADGTIYAAKNETEAEAIGKDSKPNLTDPLDDAKMKQNADVRNKKNKLV